MVNKSKNIGTAAESAVVKVCKMYGFPDAHRNSLHGSVDIGDIWIHPQVVIEVKGGAAANSASDGQLNAWMAETRRERDAHKAVIGILVTTRKGVGPANADRWDAHVTLEELRVLMGDAAWGRGWLCHLAGNRVRLSLGVVLQLLNQAGFAPRLEEE